MKYPAWSQHRSWRWFLVTVIVKSFRVISIALKTDCLIDPLRHLLAQSRITKLQLTFKLKFVLLMSLYITLGITGFVNFNVTSVLSTRWRHWTATASSVMNWWCNFHLADWDDKQLNVDYSEGHKTANSDGRSELALSFGGSGFALTDWLQLLRLNGQEVKERQVPGTHTRTNLKFWLCVFFPSKHARSHALVHIHTPLLSLILRIFVSPLFFHSLREQLNHMK